MESDVRFFRRRAIEELTAASRAVTPAARDRRVDLARRFLDHIDQSEARDILAGWGYALPARAKPSAAATSRAMADLHA